MKRPSFQFYPGDWSSNPNLKRCTFAERGIWVDVMCLMHDQEPYGVLRWPLKEIAQAVGCKVQDLQALARKGVLKGDDEHLAEPFVYVPRSGRKDGEPVTLVPTQAGPVWYSSRMVKDEHVRTIRGESSGNGEAPKPAPKGEPKLAPKGDIGAAFGPRGSSSSSSEKIKTLVEPADADTTAPPAPPLKAKDLIAEGVEPQKAADWLALRKAKRLPLTPTAWSDTKAEGQKVGLTPPDTVAKAVANNWAGFKAAWVLRDAGGKSAIGSAADFEGVH